MDREAKLAAARKKLAKFQTSKTVHPSKQPTLENISREPIVNPSFVQNGDAQHTETSVLPSVPQSNIMAQNTFQNNSALSALEVLN